MNNDKELVEVWRKEFEQIYLADGCYFCKESNRYRDRDGFHYAHNTNIRYSAWLAAKRSQPSVVLPNSKSFPSIGHPMDKLGVHGYELALSDVKSALTAAGIKYTIGE